LGADFYRGRDGLGEDAGQRLRVAQDVKVSSSRGQVLGSDQHRWGAAVASQHMRSCSTRPTSSRQDWDGHTGPSRKHLVGRVAGSGNAGGWREVGGRTGTGSLARQTVAMNLESYELVMLRRPSDAIDYDEATLERIQAEHLAFHAALRAEGTVVTNGPVRDQPDESLRGLTFYRVGSLDEARRIAEQDPSVRAGRLVVDVMHWICPAGSMTRPGRPFAPSQ